MSAATASSAGAMALHGPHHSAKKSTTTGSDDFSTSWSKFASDTESVAPPLGIELVSLGCPMRAHMARHTRGKWNRCRERREGPLRRQGSPGRVAIADVVPHPASLLESP